MLRFKRVQELMKCFPGSFINSSGDIIFDRDANIYFNIESCEDGFTLTAKVIEWLSRPAFKTCPFSSDARNEQLHHNILTGINNFLGTKFTSNDMEIIYTYLGNAIRHEDTIDFIWSGFEMKFFDKYKENKQ